MRLLFILIASLYIAFPVRAAETVSLQFFSNEFPLASGSGTYEIKDGGKEAQFDFQFSSLVPNSKYQILCYRSELPPIQLTKESVCEGIDFSKFNFRSNDKGDGTLGVALYTPLPKSTKEKFTILAVQLEKKEDIHLIAVLPVQEIVPAPIEKQKIISARTGFIALSIFLVCGLVVIWRIVKKRIEKEGVIS